MINEVLNNEMYQELVKNQLTQMMELLVSQDIEFSITANVNCITFEPMLPNVIYSKLGTFALFTLSGYTFSTIEFGENEISFEAGFGKENFGSVLSVPNEAIFQIIVDESILYLNPLATVENIVKKVPNKEKSKNIFKNNPKNKGLFD